MASSEYRFMSDTQLEAKLKELAFDAIANVITDPCYNLNDDPTDAEKILTVFGIITLFDTVQEDMRRERESNGTADN